MYKIIICFVISGLFFSCAKNETDRNSINEQEGAPVSETSSGNILLNNYDETVPYIIGVKNDDLTLQKALYCGYPYMEHLKNDADLNNILRANNGSYLESLEEIYNNRAENPFVGKAYKEYLGGAAAVYHFIDPLRMIVSHVNMNSPGGVPSSWVDEYYIKDNEIIISRFIEIITEAEGIGGGSVRINIDDLTNPLLEVYNNQRFTEIPIGNFNHFYPLKLSLMEWEKEYGYE